MTITRPLSNQPLPQDAKKVFSGLLFEVYQWEQKLYDGTTTTFEKIKRRDTAGIVAITKDKKIILTRQEQPGIQPFISTAGGVIDTNEDPFEAAKRELLEETGYASEQWELYSASQPTTKIDWAIFIFLARNCEKVADLHLDPGEKVTVMEVSFDDFLAITKQDNFRDKELALHLYRLSGKPHGLEELREKLLS